MDERVEEAGAHVVVQLFQSIGFDEPQDFPAVINFAKDAT